MENDNCQLSKSGYDDFMGFGEHLKGELEYKGMLVKELANATGIPKQTIDKYLLTNGVMPSADKAVTIARTLGVTVEYLITGRTVPYTKMPHQILSAEMRKIADHVEPLSYEKRKIVEQTVAELVRLLRQPLNDEPLALSTLQKVFLRLFQ